MAERRVGVGLIGCGTVGGRVLTALVERRALLAARTGLLFEPVVICDKDPSREALLPGRFTADPMAAAADPRVDILVELTGGVEGPLRFVREAVRRGKSVVTANKALLSEQGEDIFRRAERAGVHVGFEASVGGAVPVIKAIRESFVGNRVTRLLAILNGTTNFILSRMTRDRLSFAEALASARSRGYAEADPTLDLSGMDAAHKLSILCRLAFGARTALRDIHVEGIAGMDSIDIAFAAEFGFRVKLLAVAERTPRGLSARVHPALLPADHILSLVEDVYNAVYLEGDMFGKTLLFGEGAGGDAAASSVVADIVEIGLKIAGGRAPAAFPPLDPKAVRAPFGETAGRSYFRFTAVDKPGVLAGISRVLGRNGISIASVMQKQEDPGKPVPIVMVTQAARERDIARALAAVDRLSIAAAPTVRLRIAD